MSTRRERAVRKNRTRCKNCKEFGAHFDPWTKSYICKYKEAEA